jgi:hypothetical protein
VSTEFSKRYLCEWLDTVPVNKLLGFGGDYIFVEGVYGHLCIARQNIGRALAAKVAEGAFDIRAAKRYAAMMLYDNPESLYN